MPESSQINKILKDAMKSGKYSLGAKEVSSTVKNTKAILFTKSVPAGTGEKIRQEAKRHDVPVIELKMTSAELARMIGRPYKVSAMGLRTLSEVDLKSLQK